MDLRQTSSCPACARLARCGPSDPFFVCEMRESFFLVHKHQRYEGWCTLWLKDHHEHLGLLPRARQVGFAEDVIDAAAAIHGAFAGVRINYENLGNVVAHVHCHLIPRRATDPNPRATVWVRPESETECGAEEAAVRAMAGELRRLVERGR